MRLVDLDPKWLNADVFSFRCPHCLKTTLLCKRVVLSFKEQVRLINAAPEDDYDWPIDFVPMRADYAWKFVGYPDFDALTVTPSIHAGASGHWHGNITAGEIVGGEQLEQMRGGPLLPNPAVRPL